MRTGYLLSIVLIAAVVGAVDRSAMAAGAGWGTDFRQAQATARKLNRPVLAHFHAAWCGPCRRMEREVLGSGEIARELTTRFVGVKVDADRHPELLKQYGIRSLPADLLLSPDGKVISLDFGYQPKPLYLARMDRVAAKFVSKSDEAKPPAELPKVATKPEKTLVGLDGYCPVSLWNWREWRRGQEQFQLEHKGVTYKFASASEKKSFETDPERYVPQLLGCDPVILYRTDRAITGTTKFGAYFDGSLYLFTTEETRTEFKEHPIRFTRTRHVLRVDQLETTVTR